MLPGLDLAAICKQMKPFESWWGRVKNKETGVKYTNRLLLQNEAIIAAGGEPCRLLKARRPTTASPPPPPPATHRRRRAAPCPSSPFLRPPSPAGAHRQGHQGSR